MLMVLGGTGKWMGGREVRYFPAGDLVMLLRNIWVGGRKSANLASRTRKDYGLFACDPATY